MKTIKRILSCFLTLFLITGCGFKDDEEEKGTSLKSIELELEDDNKYYTNQTIEVEIDTEPDYQLTEDDFSLFGGEIKVKGDTAYLTFKSAGKFHIYAQVEDVKSNKLAITIKSSTTSKVEEKEEEQEETKENKETEKEEVKKDKNDLTDWENLRDAPGSKVKQASEIANASDSYINQTFAMEGYVPLDGDGTFMETGDGQKIALTGLEIEYTGKIRVYGTYDGNSFKVRSYCAYSNTKVKENAD